MIDEISIRKEYSNPDNAIRRGGMNGDLFWNRCACSFMYAPSFDFTPIHGCKNYLYVAEDVSGEKYEFTADSTYALLSPIWDDLASGQVQLMVYALDSDGKKIAMVGARSFHKSAPFTNKYPAAACDYRTSAKMAYEYLFTLQYVTDLAKKGAYNEEYALSIYVTKMLSAIISAMIKYTQLNKEKAEYAMQIAINAADFLIEHSAPKGTPLEGLPPTYYYDEDGDNYYYRKHPITSTRVKNTMLIYPAHAGSSYIELYQKTNNKKYLNAALVIAEYYKTHVCENGTWYQIVSVKTGEPVSDDYCIPTVICRFLEKIFDITKEQEWKTLAKNGYDYIRKNCLKIFHWGGQFEDAVLSAQYSNLTHFEAIALINDITKNSSDDEKEMAIAKELMRYVEDQFVVWDNPPEYNKDGWDTSIWHYPCGLEQYYWYVPIDGSTATIFNAFINMHKVTQDELYLRKARVLADSITRIQNPKNGCIPTHWFEQDCMETGGDLWINCMIGTANYLFDFADYLDKLAKD